MNYAHLHLILNHIPVIGIGLVTLLLILAIFRKSKELTIVSLLFMILVALATIPVYFTGEPAEEVVEEMRGVSEQLIEQHEEVAEIAFILVEITGAFALIALIAWHYSDRFGQALSIFMLLGLIVSGGFIAQTANLGGKIHHEEIRAGVNSQGTFSNRLYRDDD
ncbi:MAG TPA: hypothetical protein VHT73_11445 [Thermodesulfobacteriota bacterium]|nr:hypothetical protein [Thermodesulfobacteriota bacterium]